MVTKYCHKVSKLQKCEIEWLNLKYGKCKCMYAWISWDSAKSLKVQDIQLDLVAAYILRENQKGKELMHIQGG